ncbi:hypothetical protein ACIBI4_05340 [Streptomyces sp. NPDC050418]|uniref:hypothetical protein n=1 Tax=Streptomyces sp. NPDC050418 TaxID=3365612 RepID=UPI00379541EC
MTVGRTRRFTAGVVAVVALGGCGTTPGASEDLVHKPTERSVPPYDGPLKARTPGWVGEDSPLEGGGAALLTLECTDDPYQASSGHDLGNAEREPTPEAALRRQFGEWRLWKILPQRGYRIETRSGGRVLFSYDVLGRTRAAVIVAEDIKGKDGWVVETYAQCDPSEFEAAERADLDLFVWSDTAGRPVNTARVHSAMGPDHCDWQTAEFLGIGSGRQERGYYRDPEGVLGDSDLLHASYDGDTRLPDDAVDTGWRHDGRELWLAPDKKNAYVRTADGKVERWPGSSERIGCA